jgi:hypothetical protein
MYSKEELVNYLAAISARPVIFDCCDGCRAANPNRKVMKQQNRPQRQKSGKVRQVQELRRSNAATPIPSATEYKRNLKYGIIWDEESDENDNPYLWR